MYALIQVYTKSEVKDPCYAFDNINISRKNGLSIRLATLFVNLELGLSQLVQVFKTGVFGEKIIVMRSSFKKLFKTQKQEFSFRLGVFRLRSVQCFYQAYVLLIVMLARFAM